MGKRRRLNIYYFRHITHMQNKLRPIHQKVSSHPPSVLRNTNRVCKHRGFKIPIFMSIVLCPMTDTIYYKLCYTFVLFDQINVKLNFRQKYYRGMKKNNRKNRNNPYLEQRVYKLKNK